MIVAKPAATAAPLQKAGATPLAAVKPGVAPPSGDSAAKPKRRWMIIVLALLVLAGGGAAAWYFIGGEAHETKAGEAKAQPHAPVFMNLDPFTVNLAEESGDHYLQAGIVLQVRDDKTVETLKAYMPVVRNRILLLLSAKHPSELATAEGKKKLIDEIVQATGEALPASGTDRGIVGALFSAFVIQ